MWIEQEQGNPCGIKPRLFRNHGKWRRLVGRCAGLDGCHKSDTPHTTFAPTVRRYSDPQQKLEGQKQQSPTKLRIEGEA
jgi:hypothetical protein